MVVQWLWCRGHIWSFLDFSSLFLFTKEGIGKQDSCVGIYDHQCFGNSSTMASLAFRKDSVIFFGKGTHWHHLHLVGLPSLCYRMCDRLAVNQENECKYLKSGLSWWGLGLNFQQRWYPEYEMLRPAPPRLRAATIKAVECWGLTLYSFIKDPLSLNHQNGCREDIYSSPVLFDWNNELLAV